MATARRSPASERRDPTRVVFGADFLARLERLVARVSGLRSRADSAGGAGRGAGGDEFAGHRPYRPGEDLRGFDWELFARLEQPFVRVHRRAAGERWCVVLDTSASMGLGEPGKLQFAAEALTGIAFCGLAAGATTSLVARGSGGLESVRLRRRTDLGAWLAFVEARRASGSGTLRELCDHPAAAAAQRLFAVGDLFDSEPGDLLVLARRGRTVTALRVLARHELTPAPAPGVEWLDPESGERVESATDRVTLEAYAGALERRLERWRSSFAGHGQRSVVAANDAHFEDVVREVLEGAQPWRSSSRIRAH